MFGKSKMFVTKNKNQKTTKIRNSKKKLLFTIFYVYFIGNHFNL